MANSLDPDQTAPGFRLFAAILNSSVMLGALRVKTKMFADETNS